MNLMEITKGYKPKQNEQMDQTMYSLDTTDKWKQLAKEQAETLEKVSAERDELQVRNQKMNEFIQEFQERTHKLKMEKQQLFFENHEMQEEMQKSNAEIQQMTVELSEMRKLNQSLQQSNDDLRNRNGLMSRSEQERLEEEIKDVRDRNSKLQIQVNQSSVEAVEQAQQKQEEAEKKVRTIQCQYNKLQENAETMKEKADQKIKSLKQEMKEKTSFWQMAYIIFLVFEMIKSTVVQNDLIACIKVPVRVWCRYVEWVIRPSELNIWGEKEYFSTEWSWCLRVMAIIIIVGAVIAGEMFVLKKIEQYRRVWDKYSIRFMVVSLEMIIVSSDVLRRCMPINLVVLFGIINIAVIEIRIYYRRANEIY